MFCLQEDLEESNHIKDIQIKCTLQCSKLLEVPNFKLNASFLPSLVVGQVEGRRALHDPPADPRGRAGLVSRGRAAQRACGRRRGHVGVVRDALAKLWVKTSGS